MTPDLPAAPDLPGAVASPHRSLPRVSCAARPMVYVVRYCGTEESSVASAIRQGLAVLDDFLERQGVAPSSELVIVYRNRLPGAVAIAIGYPVPQAVAAAARSDVLAGVTPSGPMVALLPGGSLDEVLDAGAGLPEGPSSYTWQTFAAADFRPWRAHPSAPLLAPVDVVPHPTDVTEP